MKKLRKIFACICVITVVFSLLCFSACGNKNKNATTYDIDCEFDGSTLCGVERVSFFNDTENVFNEIKFNLFPNAFREDAKYSPISVQYEAKAYYDGKSYGGIEINGVLVNEENVEFTVGGEDKNILIVPLKVEVYPSERVNITVDFKTTIPKNVSRMGINNHTVNLTNFYPILCGIENQSFYENVYYSNGDPFFSDVANYTVKLKASTDYVVASSGKVIEKKECDGKNQFTFKGENMRSFGFVLSKNYKVITDNSLGVEINYYYYDDENAQKHLEYATKSIKLFNEIYGQYPYPTYSVCKTEFIQGGMEYPAMVMISDELDGESFGEVIVHETAHQWWQSTVGNNEIKYGFLDEGLAEYSTIVFYENYPEYEITRESLVQKSELTYKTFCSVYDKIFKKVDTTMIRSLGEFSSEYEYVNIAYIKTCIMYDSLRKTIGDEKFFTALKRYYKDFTFKNATPFDLVGSFEKCGLKTEGFFNSFFDGKVIL